MNDSKHYDEGLEEIWRIKREIAAEYPTLEDFFNGMEEYRRERIREGVKLVRFPSGRFSRQIVENPLFASEPDAEYDAHPPASSPTP